MSLSAIAASPGMRDQLRAAHLGRSPAKVKRDWLSVRTCEDGPRVCRRRRMEHAGVRRGVRGVRSDGGGAGIVTHPHSHPGAGRVDIFADLLLLLIHDNRFG